MLLKRITTAALLLAILLPALFFGSSDVLNGLALIVIAAGVWEWARMNGYRQTQALFFALDAFVVCAGVMYLGLTRYPMPMLWLVVTALWVVIASYLLRTGVASWAHIPQLLRLVLGGVLICTTWLALAQLRQVGINLLLSSLLLVWAADIFAYAAGRLLGGKLFGGFANQGKLAVAISPGKTWEGVLGGFVGVLLVAYFWLWLDQKFVLDSLSLYTLLHVRFGGWMLLALIFLTMLSVVGDLIESLVKRSAGVKDSSGLLPGHGGVLDRVDALLPVLPAAMLFVSFA
ncbi:MAG: phosphatidate cytidylyltransferase [Cytophagales bacterium]|nr:phosphatidate cytidylyltransferase [Cytophagales bacterium]